MVLVVRNLPANAGDLRSVGLIPGFSKIPWRRAWQPTPVFIPGESDRRRTLESYSIWGRKVKTQLNALQAHMPHPVHLVSSESFRSFRASLVAQLVTNLPAIQETLLWPHFLGNKLTQKDNADSRAQLITPLGPRQSLLLAKDPDQHLWKPFIPHVYMSKPTTPNSLKLT